MASKHRTALARRLPRYATAVAAAVAAPSAPGAIIYINSSYAVSSASDNPSSSIPWDIDLNGYTDVFLDHTLDNHELDAVGVGRSNGSGDRLDVYFVRHNPAANFLRTTGRALPLGFTIGPAMAASAKFGSLPDIGFTRGYVGNGRTHFSATGNLTIGNQYIGFEFGINGQYHYGWANITISSTGQGVTINDWAYNSIAGQSIQAGQVPEPSQAAIGLGLLALGAAGVSAYKRRKIAAQ
ncbi:MAG: hypothetical protein ABSH19_03270 [Opitutales bacterium]|jgi:hypothetical protein